MSEPTADAFKRAEGIVKPFSIELDEGILVLDTSIDETEALIRAIAAALPQWQPIEKFPTPTDDETERFLLYCADEYKPFPIVGFWLRHRAPPVHQSYSYDGGSWWADGDPWGEADLLLRPTHWMPLQTPP